MPFVDRPTLLDLSGRAIGGAAGGISSASLAASAPSIAAGIQTILAGGGTGAFVGSVAGAFAGAAIPLIGVIPIIIGLTASLARQRFPRIPIGAGGIGETIAETRALRSRGLEPLVVTDPFSGNIGIATEDQRALLGTLFQAAAIQREAGRQDTSQLSAARNRFVEAQRESAAALGFEPALTPELAALRVQPIRPSPDAPLQLLPRPS